MQVGRRLARDDLQPRSARGGRRDDRAGVGRDAGGGLARAVDLAGQRQVLEKALRRVEDVGWAEVQRAGKRERVRTVNGEVRVRVSCRGAVAFVAEVGQRVVAAEHDIRTRRRNRPEVVHLAVDDESGGVGADRPVRLVGPLRVAADGEDAAAGRLDQSVVEQAHRSDGEPGVPRVGVDRPLVDDDRRPVVVAAVADPARALDDDAGVDRDRLRHLQAHGVEVQVRRRHRDRERVLPARQAVRGVEQERRSIGVDVRQDRLPVEGERADVVDGDQASERLAPVRREGRGEGVRRSRLVLFVHDADPAGRRVVRAPIGLADDARVENGGGLPGDVHRPARIGGAVAEVPAIGVDRRGNHRAAEREAAAVERDGVGQIGVAVEIDVGIVDRDRRRIDPTLIEHARSVRERHVAAVDYHAAGRRILADHSHTGEIVVRVPREVQRASLAVEDHAVLDRPAVNGQVLQLARRRVEGLAVQVHRPVEVDVAIRELDRPDVGERDAAAEEKLTVRDADRSLVVERSDEVERSALRRDGAGVGERPVEDDFTVIGRDLAVVGPAVRAALADLEDGAVIRFGGPAVGEQAVGRDEQRLATLVGVDRSVRVVLDRQERVADLAGAVDGVAHVLERRRRAVADDLRGRALAVQRNVARPGELQPARADRDHAGLGDGRPGVGVPDHPDR